MCRLAGRDLDLVSGFVHRGELKKSVVWNIRSLSSLGWVMSSCRVFGHEVLLPRALKYDCSAAYQIH